MWEITLQQNGKDNEAEFCPEGKYDKERKIKKGYRYSTCSMYELNQAIAQHLMQGDLQENLDRL